MRLAAEIDMVRQAALGKILHAIGDVIAAIDGPVVA